MIPPLLSCPGCGERLASVLPAPAGTVVVACVCGWQSPARNTATEAVTGWNQRVGLKPFLAEVCTLTAENETLRSQLLGALSRPITNPA
jgi:hypothetical protein